MSHASHLFHTRTPMELAEMVAALARENARLKDQVGALQTELFWMKVKERDEQNDT